MNWIRVAIGIHDDPAIARMADQCKARVSDIVGCVVGVLVKLPEQARDGVISHIPDTLLEQWAHWNGKRGAFAKAFRSELCNPDGLIRTWEKHNGAHLREYDRQAEKARQYRDKNKIVPGTVDGTVPQEYQPYGTERNGTERTTSSNLEDGVVTPPPIGWEKCAPVVAESGHDALHALLSAVPNPHDWAIAIHAQASGQSAAGQRPVSRSRLAAAIVDFVGKSKHREREPSPKLFRRFVEVAKTPHVETLYPTLEEERAKELAVLREVNDKKRVRNQPVNPEPGWALEIDAMFPDGRTRPELKLNGAHP